MESTKEKIVDSSIALFYTDGYYAIGVEDIVEQGVGEGRGAQDLVLERAQQLHRLGDQVQGPVVGGGHAAGQLDAAGLAVVEPVAAGAHQGGEHDGHHPVGQPGAGGPGRGAAGPRGRGGRAALQARLTPAQQATFARLPAAAEPETR